MSKNSYLYGTVLLLSLLSSLIFTELVLDAHNTLYLNDNWIVEKRNRKMQVMGSDDFLTGRNALAKESLQLHHWHGHQKLTLKESHHWTSLRFALSLSEESRLSVFLNGDRDEIRLSLNPHYPSGVVNHENKWFIPKEFDLTTGSSLVEFKLDSERKLILQVDDKTYPLDLILEESSSLSFQGGREQVSLDDIEIFQNNQRVFQDNFRNSYLEKTYWVIHLGLLLVLALIIKLILKSFYPVIMLQIVLLISLFSYSVFDHFYWSNQNYNTLTKGIASENPHDKIPLFEFGRFQFFHFWTPQNTSYPKNIYTIKDKGYPFEQLYRGPFICQNHQCHKTNIKRIMQKPNIDPNSREVKLIAFLGSSQMVGSGALDINHTHFGLLYHRLRKENKDKSPMLLNLSDSSLAGLELYEKYRELLYSLKPEVLFLNLSFNDTTDSLESVVEQFLEDPKLKGIDFVLIQEPVSKEYSEDLIYRITADLDHLVLARLAQKYDVELLPLHRLIEERQDEYPIELWWDVVHLNSAGQEVWAEELWPMLKELIN